MFEVFTWFLASVSLCGAYLNASHNKYGFILWSFTNFCWMVVDWKRGIKAQAALYAAFLGICIYGLYTW